MNNDRLANLIIAGVNKAATTSLYTYLAQHPDVCGSSIKETHFFMRVLSGEWPQPMDAYAEYFKDCAGRRYRMEASPRYIFGGAKLASAVREALGPVRIVFVLRQPVDRMVSYFKHMKRTNEVDAGLSCDDYARRALAELPDALSRAGGRPVDVYAESVFLRGLAQGFYADYLAEWYAVFPDSTRIYFFEDVTYNPGAVMLDLCQWLRLDEAVYRNAQFTWENRSIAHRNKTFYQIGQFINQTCEPFWRKHSKLKDYARDLYCRLNEKRPEERDLTPGVRADLERVYAPYNRRLAEMLAPKGYGNLPDWLSKHAHV